MHYLSADVRIWTQRADKILMILSQLHTTHLRNLTSVEIQPNPRLNCLIGANGSGKTSLLEAIHLLGLGRSFRTPHLNRVVQQGADELLVFAELQELGNELSCSKLGFSRDSQGKTRMKRNGETVSSIAELAELLPVLLLYAESYTLFRDSPKSRRKWLDWVCSTWNLFFSFMEKAATGIAAT